MSQRPEDGPPGRPDLASRLAHIPPHVLEASGPLTVLCELVDELVTATNQQTVALTRMAAAAGWANTRMAVRPADSREPEPEVVPETPEKTTTADGKPEGDEQGGAQVLLREPGLPPDDPDDEPAAPSRAVADPAADPGKAGRSPARKATPAKKAAAKTPQAPREGRR